MSINSSKSGENKCKIGSRGGKSYPTQPSSSKVMKTVESNENPIHFQPNLDDGVILNVATSTEYDAHSTECALDSEQDNYDPLEPLFTLEEFENEIWFDDEDQTEENNSYRKAYEPKTIPIIKR